MGSLSSKFKKKIYKHFKKIVLGLSIWSLWSPTIYLIFQLTGVENKEFFNFTWLTPKTIFQIVFLLVIIFIIFMMLGFHESNLMSKDRKPISIPDSEEKFWNKNCVKLARKNPDYEGSVDFMMDNDYKFLSQKLFSSIIAVTTILFSTLPQKILTPELKNLFLLYICITGGIYILSFLYLYFASLKKEKRSIWEYLFMFYSILGNLFAIVFFLILFFDVSPSVISNSHKLNISSICFRNMYLGAIFVGFFIFFISFVLVPLRVHKFKQKWENKIQ